MYVYIVHVLHCVHGLYIHVQSALDSCLYHLCITCGSVKHYIHVHIHRLPLLFCHLTLFRVYCCIIKRSNVAHAVLEIMPVSYSVLSVSLDKTT